jgi:hypothetical protein
MRPGSQLGEPRVDPRKIVAYVLLSLGVLCVGVGVGLALLLAWVVYLLVRMPTDVPLFAELMGLSTTRLQAFSGNLDGRTFEVVLGEPLFWILLLLVAVLLVAAIGAVARVLVRIGGDLVRQSRSQ